MNSKFIASAVVALAALTGANAFAQAITTGEATYFAPVAGASNLTRAQVQSQYLQALSSGDVAPSNEVTFVPAVTTASATSRATVRAEAVTWVKTHATTNDAM